VPSPAPRLNWAVVVPVKVLARAKSRLRQPTGRQRAELALAMATDTVAATLACPRVSGVLVVTDDQRARGELMTLGAVVVDDAPDRGLNAALEHGAEQARLRFLSDGVAALSADLPALRPRQLAVALDRCGGHPRSFVCDSSGIGTTLLTVRGHGRLDPAFGPRSRARHRAGGAHEVTEPDIWSLRRDVDTDVDLHDALRLGVGARTTRVVATPVSGG
jgi:2-phospho-L-lactate/phosphoenolpyruvate guanylyltransferase